MSCSAIYPFSQLSKKVQSWLDKRPKDWSHGSGQTKAKELSCSPSEGILMYVWNCKTGWKTIKNGLALEESPDVRKYIYYNSETSIRVIPYKSTEKNMTIFLKHFLPKKSKVFDILVIETFF